MKMAPLFLALALCAAGGASSPSEPPRAGSPCPQEGGLPAIHGEPPSPAAEGPFDAGRRQRKSPGDAVESASFPPADGFDPSAEYEGIGGKTIFWRKISLGPGERVLDLKPLAPCDFSSEFGVAYLHATIASPSARRTVLRWANDWFGAIWLNGEAVVPTMNGPSKEYGSVEVHLRPGANEILVKSAAGSSGAWFFGMAVDDDGTLQY